LPRLYVVLEGGPGVGKSSIAGLLAELLRSKGLSVCVVHDSSREVARVLGRLFGKWYLAPRTLIEYMILGHQVHGLQRCKEMGADIVLLDYGIEAPLAYMEADGASYPRELDSLAEALLDDAPVLVFILERPVTYTGDNVRWEDLLRAQRYSRSLIRRASSLAARLGAAVYVVPEKRSLHNRVLVVARLIYSFLDGDEPSPVS